jgi:hypothetical protein
MPPVGMMLDGLTSVKCARGELLAAKAPGRN